MSRVAQHHRSGAALIIAIVVLAALLMLGLPFLFTQSGSLSGTRSYAHSELANIGQDSAQSMGVKAGAEAVGYHWQQDGMKRPRVPDPSPLIINDWTSLFYDLGGRDDPQSGVHKMSENLLSFNTRNHVFALPGGNFLSGMSSDERDIQLRRYPIVVGLTIQDESGKLNPNYLDAVAWSRLFRGVGINDWPDSLDVSTPGDQGRDGRNQLARALAALRYRLAGGRITSLDQLLRAEPSAERKPRRGLTRSELELLRPYLSLSVPSQARGGMIDLGTVIGSSGSKISIDSTPPEGLIAFPITPQVIGVGTTLLVEDDKGMVRALPFTGREVVVVPQIGDPLAIDAPPLVNVHQAEEQVRKVLAVRERELPIAKPPVAANPSATTPILARLLAPALISELNSNDYSSIKPVDALGRTRSWFELTSPLSIPEELGSADVVKVYDNATSRVELNILDAEAEKTVPGTAFYLEIAGDSLDHFPNIGYAKLVGTLAAVTLPAARQQDFEFVYYTAFDALPQSAGSARANGRVGVQITRGKLSPIAKSFKLTDLKFIAIAPREQHPVGIASQGVISIASAATVTDPAGNQTAQQQHRVIAQALPQETPLEARWNKQAAFHALLAQRHGSLMTTFPQPYPRITDIMPDDPANNAPPAPAPTDLDDMAGIRPAVMRTLLSSSHLNTQWQLPLSGESATALLGGGFPPSSTAYTTADVTPEGLRLDSSRVLSYPNPSNGFLKYSIGADPSIQGRQFSLWVRPDEEWNSPVTLLDMRIDEGNRGKSLTGVLQSALPEDDRAMAPSNVDVCNRFALRYDPSLKQLILVLNPVAVPHTSNYGPKIPRETYEIPLAVNQECLGSGGAEQMAMAPPETSIQHRYALGSAFITGTWHLIQVAFSSNQPGGMSIIVDGLVGRDVTLLASTANPVAMSLPGDHVTLPSMVLRQNISAPDPSVDGANALYLNKIKLDACAQVGGAMVTGGAAVKALLPNRGIVRIGNEYISYQSITVDSDGNGLLNECLRARRQQTGAQWSQVNRLEQHETGAPVVPGGFAIGNQGDNLWRGDCLLAQAMPDGDPTHNYQVHATVNVVSPAIVAAGETTIPLNGDLKEFPMRGYVMANNSVLYYYDNRIPLPSSPAVPGKFPNIERQLRNIIRWTATSIVPDPARPGEFITTDSWDRGTISDLSAGETIVLVSVELSGDPTKSNAYNFVRKVGETPFYPQAQGTGALLQLYDTDGGRAEWVEYTSIDSRTYPTGGDAVSYLMNITLLPADLRPGFWFDKILRAGLRGRGRTAFAKEDFTSYSPARDGFPVGTRVIPVQTRVSSGHRLEAGDVVTLASVNTGTVRLCQMCVRYSASHGFSDDINIPPIDAGRSKYFAFTDAIPETWNTNKNAYQLLCWPCWTPKIDLSPGPASIPTLNPGWVLPWGTAYAPNFNDNGGKISILADSNSSPGNKATIDAVCSGPQIDQAHVNLPGIWLDDQPLRERTVVVANQGIFTDLYGIVEIGGETFAYKQWDNESDPFVQSTTQAWLIGRSLLGSTARIHKGPELILRLPIGPVTEVIGSVPPPPVTIPPTPPKPMGIDFTGPLDLVPLPAGRSFNPPAVLLTSRDGKSQEITVLPNNHTAPWLRGMYNTTPINWAVRPPVPAIAPPPTNGSQPPPLPPIPNLAPLAIGWWPRYPSGYPKDLSTRAADERAAFLRCRSYAWAGFPLRFHDTQFGGTDLAQVTALSTGGGLFDLQALALDGRMDWGVAKMDSLLNGNNSNAFNSEIFKVLTDESLNSRLTNEAGAIRTVDGAELRIIWTYRDKPLIEDNPAASPAEWLQEAARSGNSAPMIGPVYLRARAPNKVISVER